MILCGNTVEGKIERAGAGEGTPPRADSGQRAEGREGRSRLTRLAYIHVG